SVLRVEYLAALERPTRAELEEELHLITTMSVIIDLVAQGWNIESVDSAVTLSLTKDGDVDVEKQRLRKAHLLDRDAQLGEASVAQFIRGMEKRRLTPRGWHSIYSVMRGGESLAEQLEAGSRPGSESAISLHECIQPYLQFVTPDGICEHTGLRTNDIWRYFRHTWVNSYRSVPGRSMMILVRDAAAENHPVIGIAALGSSVVQQSVRDKWIGWDGETTLRRLENMTPSAAVDWLLGKTDGLIKDVYLDDLLRDGTIARPELRCPSAEVIDRLLAVSQKAIAQHRLYPQSSKHSDSKKVKLAEWKLRSEAPLFKSKRTKQLAKLLNIRVALQAHEIHKGMTRTAWRTAIASPKLRSVVGQLIRFVKSERVGINMMDITVCVAIAPYNHLLGGKLVCMLLCSPEVNVEYGRRYGGQTSLIASAMRGRAVNRSAELVLLCTTSLYGSALSQYSRVKIPVAVVSGKDNGKIEYKELGASEGFGSFHFSKETLRLFGMVIGRAKEARKVNSIFGEGVNPLMRKIRDAMAVLGLPAEALLRHGNRRVVYGVSLADN
ncbi:MAG: Druantia anti-phage system protein DruA, partial [Candidatus Micrarchaeaceae archaeon]